MKRKSSILSIVVILALLAMACSISALPQGIGQVATATTAVGLPNTGATQAPSDNTQVTVPATLAPIVTVAPQPTAVPALPSTGNTSAGALSAFEGTMETIYAQIIPSVVNIHVVINGSGASSGSQINPFGNPNSQGAQEALGSGFVWDQKGDIVTNNHVVADATSIDVTFADGTNVPAKVVGTDVYSDLAVVKVDVPASALHPVSFADSKQVRVGQLAIAIGNPFGLSGTMTEGIISALGRSLPVDSSTTQAGGSYTIPDVIQTDAAINPGNSGGVLVDDQGKVIGVTSAIESSTNSNAGIGFAIPSAIVQKVVPALIKSGKYEHSWLGTSGTDLTPDLARAMNLNPQQRGALIETVTSGGPAAKAGLKASTRNVTINGQQGQVGGDVIIAIDNNPMKSMDDVIAYLAGNTEVGQKVTLTILRNGKQMNVVVTLGARPASANPNNPSLGSAGGAFVGLNTVPVNSRIARSMGLPSDLQGLLIQEVAPNSPADQAGLQGGSRTVTVNGQQVIIGGDIILAIDGQPVATQSDLESYLQQAQVGQQSAFTILRNGQQGDVVVTLGSTP